MKPTTYSIDTTITFGNKFKLTLPSSNPKSCDDVSAFIDVLMEFNEQPVQEDIVQLTDEHMEWYQSSYIENGGSGSLTEFKDVTISPLDCVHREINVHSISKETE